MPLRYVIAPNNTKCTVSRRNPHAFVSCDCSWLLIYNKQTNQLKLWLSVLCFCVIHEYWNTAEITKAKMLQSIKNLHKKPHTTAIFLLQLTLPVAFGPRSYSVLCLLGEMAKPNFLSVFIFRPVTWCFSHSTNLKILVQSDCTRIIIFESVRVHDASTIPHFDSWLKSCLPQWPLRKMQH